MNYKSSKTILGCASMEQIKTLFLTFWMKISWNAHDQRTLWHSDWQLNCHLKFWNCTRNPCWDMVSNVHCSTMPFQSSWCHLVRSKVTFLQQCKSYKFGPQVWGGTTCNLIHVCLFLITRPLVHHKTKINSLETSFWKDNSHQILYGQTLTVKYKGLTVKVKTKYLWKGIFTAQII